MKPDGSFLFPSLREIEAAMKLHGVDTTEMPIDDVFAAIARKLTELKEQQNGKH